MATRTFIAIGGGTASGKTTLAERIRDSAPHGEVSIIPVDSYYHPQRHLSPDARSRLNYDHPDALDFSLIHSHLQALSRGESVPLPVYDFATHDRKPEAISISASPIVVVEGILALHDEVIRSHSSLRVFVDSPAELRFRRRLARDVQERGRTAESVQRQWEATVEPMHQQFCEPSRAFADIVCVGIGDYEDIVARVLGALAPVGQM